MKRLVIVDASVVRAAGETEHPVSSACRGCLLAILDICHRVGITSESSDEWKRHMSQFSRKWRRSMAARRKAPTTVERVNAPLQLHNYTEKARAAIEKDRHLLEAALAADRIIVTLDESLKSALQQCPDGIALLKTIRWIHPVVDGRRALETL